MFDKFIHDELINQNPIPDTDLVSQLKLRKKESIDSIIASTFVRTSENDVFDLFDRALQNASQSSLHDLRANALISTLLYTNLKIGQTVTLKISDFRQGVDGQKYLRFRRGQDVFLKKICAHAIVHFNSHFNASLMNSDSDEPFFQKFNRNQSATGKSISTGRAREIIYELCDLHGMNRLGSHKITRAQPLRSINEIYL